MVQMLALALEKCTRCMCMCTQDPDRLERWRREDCGIAMPCLGFLSLCLLSLRHTCPLAIGEKKGKKEIWRTDGLLAFTLLLDLGLNVVVHMAALKCKSSDGDQTVVQQLQCWAHVRRSPLHIVRLPVHTDMCACAHDLVWVRLGVKGGVKALLGVPARLFLSLSINE